MNSNGAGFESYMQKMKIVYICLLFFLACDNSSAPSKSEEEGAMPCDDMFKMGIEAYENKSFDEALYYFDKAITCDDHYTDTMAYLMPLCFLNSGNFYSALKSLQTVTSEQDYFNPEFTNYVKFYAYFNLCEYDSACFYYEKLIGIDSLYYSNTYGEFVGSKCITQPRTW